MHVSRTRTVKCPAGGCSRLSGFVDPGKTGGPASCNNDSARGNPCDAATGNKFETETDYTGSGNFPLVFHRSYNSLGYDKQTNAVSRVGSYWRASYLGSISATTPDYVLTTATTVQRGVVVNRPDGRTYYFAKVNGVWASDSDVTDTLTEGSGGWIYTTRDGTVEAYDNIPTNGVGGSRGKLLSITNRSGITQTVNYDDANGIIRVADPFGHTLTLAFAADGQLSTLTDPAGRVTRYGYDTSSNLVRVTYPDSTAKLYHYEGASHLLTGISYDNGSGTVTRLSTYVYEATGKAISTEHAGGQEKFTLAYGSGQTTVTDAIGAKELLYFSTNLGVKNLTSKVNYSNSKILYQTFDANNNLTCKTDEEGRATTYAYNSANQRVRLTEGQSGYYCQITATPTTRTTTYQYLSPALDLPTLIQSPSVAGGTNTKQVSIAYDANRNPVTIMQSGFTPAGAAVSRSIALGYNAFGQVTSIDGPRVDVADVTNISYYTCTTGGTCGQIQSVTNALGQTTTYDSYDANGRVLGITDPNGLKVVYAYDPRGRVTSITQTAPGETSRLTQYSYDVAGNVTSVSLPTGLALNYTYDAALKLRRVTDSLGNYIDYNYDLKGNRTQAYTYDPTGALMRAIDLAYDYRNRVSQLNTGGSISKQVWDALGNLTTITNPNTVAANGTTATTNSYDNLNRLFKTVDLLNGNTQYGYDVNDRLKTAQAPNGALTQYAYDDLGNLHSETSPDRGVVTYNYDPAGNVLSLNDARNITVGYSYDALNRLTHVDYPGTDEDVTYAYDSGAGCSAGVGRLCRVQDAAGASDYAYDGFGNVATHLRTELGVAYTTSYGYDAGNRITSITYPNGRVVNTTRDVRGNIQAASMILNGVTTALISGGVFRPDGLPTSRSFGNGLTDIRAYDTQGRLRELYLGSADTRLFSYDANGNLTGKQTLPEVGAYTYDTLNRLKQETRTTQGAATTTWTYDANGNRKTQNTGAYAYLAASNRLTTALGSAITLDAAGNTLSDGLRSYSYNNAGQLSQVAGAGYSYNSQNLRTRKIVGSQATVYHYDLMGNLIAETTADGNLIRDYVWGDAIPIAQVEVGETLTYLHTDHLNTPRLGTDAQGQVVWRWDGGAFGDSVPTGTRTVNLRFAGQYADAESGLHYNWNRYYDPRTGRYISSDPIGLAGGLNPYLYANANPLRFTDPTGLLTCSYDISLHMLYCENNLGQSFLTSGAVSGTGACENKSSCSGTKNEGPLPPTYYMINPPGVIDPAHPPADPNNSLWLKGPQGAPNPGNRNGLYIHLYGLSRGCIALRRPYFNLLKNWATTDNGGDLFVTE